MSARTKMRREMGDDIRREHVERRELLVRADGGLEEVDDLLVLFVTLAVALHVERRRARRVLGELVRPKIGVGATLVDPVLVHWARAAAHGQFVLAVALL